MGGRKMLGFFIGLILGIAVGVFFMGLLQASKEE
jgi:uncharacterized membrane protein YwzB